MTSNENIMLQAGERYLTDPSMKVEPFEVQQEVCRHLKSEVNH